MCRSRKLTRHPEEQPSRNASHAIPDEAVESASGAVTLFNFEGANIRFLSIDGAPCVVGKDFCDALLYSNDSAAIKRHCKGVAKRYPLMTAGGMQELRVLSEPDMYRLIFNSKLPAAERFEQWVVEEVLPSIRKTGGYEAPRRDSAMSRAEISDFVKDLIAQTVPAVVAAVVGAVQSSRAPAQTAAPAEVASAPVAAKSKPVAAISCRLFAQGS